MNYSRQKPPKKTLQTRVVNAAQDGLKTEGSVGILDVYQGLRYLERVHFEAWKKGMPHYEVLDQFIQCGEKKRQDSIKHFLHWAHEQGLEAFQVSYEKHGRHGATPLRLTTDEDAETEALFSTRFRDPNLTTKQKERVEKKSQKVPDLLVYVTTGKGFDCSECKGSFEQDFLYLEEGQTLCLGCADMDHLQFLPSGHATLTRRAKKFSSLSAVVLKFNRRRKRYDRQGILVTEAAIDQAEKSLEDDAEIRERQRARAAERRLAQDNELVHEMTRRIMDDFPNCPKQEAEAISLHTAERGSGRVGRSAAGRALDQKAIHLAVRAWIRHQHTDYDELLMSGVERMQARERIRRTLEQKADEWIG